MPEGKERRARHPYTDEFERQPAVLYRDGKRRYGTAREYDIADSSSDKKRKTNRISLL